MRDTSSTMDEVAMKDEVKEIKDEMKEEFDDGDEEEKKQKKQYPFPLAHQRAKVPSLRRSVFRLD